MVDHLVDGEIIHVVWASNVDQYVAGSGNDPDIFYERFDGNAWSVPTLVNAHGVLDNGAGNVDQNPRLALGPDGVLHCVWESQYPLGGSGTDWDVMYSRRPVGDAWQAAELVDSGMLSDGLAADIAPNVIARANGDPLVVWQVPNTNGEESLVSAIRTASGWTPRADLFAGLGLPWGDTFGPAALAQAGNGTIVAAYATTYDLQGLAGTDLDIAYSQFPTSGGWSGPVMATGDAAGDSGADRDPAVVILGSGDPADFEIHIAWASTNDVPFGATSTGTEGDVMATVIRLPSAFPPTNPAYVVNSNAEGDLYPDDKPSLCVEPGGVVHAAWQTGDAFFGDLDLLRSTNATPGGDWSPFELLNLTGLGADGDDQRVDLECGPGGTLSALWQSTDTLLGTVGTDHDLFHALGLGRVISRPEPIDPAAATDSGSDSHVDFAAGPDGVLHAVWQSSDPLIGGGTGSDVDVFYARRDGRGWSVPQLVNTTGKSDSGVDFLASLVIGRDGRVHVAWASEEDIGGDTGNDSDIFYSVLDGANWSPPELVNDDGRIDKPSDPDGDMFALLALDSQDGLHALWEKECDLPCTDRSLRWSRRSSAGWSPAEVVSGPAAPVFFAGLDGVCMLVDEDQQVPHVVWSSDSGTGGSGADADLFYTRRAGGAWSLPELVNTWGTTDSHDELDCALVRHQNGDLRVIFDSRFDVAGAGGDPDLFTTRRSSTGWSEPELLLDAFQTDAANDTTPRAVLHGSTLHLTWYRALLGVRAGYVKAAVDLAAPLPANSVTLLASNPLSLPPSGLLFVGGSTLVLTPSGILFFGYSNNVDLGGTIGNDYDVLHTWVPVFDPLIFADGFEAPATP